MKQDQEIFFSSTECWKQICLGMTSSPEKEENLHDKYAKICIAHFLDCPAYVEHLEILQKMVKEQYELNPVQEEDFNLLSMVVSCNIKYLPSVWQDIVSKYNSILLHHCLEKALDTKDQHTRTKI